MLNAEKPVMEILGKINQNSNKNKSEVFTKLYRYLLRPEIYFIAYNKLYSNNGAATKGVDDDTADGFSEEKVANLISRLKDGSYEPKPVRRTYRAKENGKMRPLGIPTFTEKLVQEALRMILEAVYEPVFSNNSHGFRPQRSCHTALKELQNRFNGVKWFIEGDIKGCFDSIDHHILIKVINTKIKDAKLIQLIWKFLKAGYVDNWIYNNTYSGTPQGGIVSPILANIYLNELDKKVEEICVEFNKPPSTKQNPEYRIQQRKIEHIRRKIKRPCNAHKRQELLKELQTERTLLLNMPAKTQSDKQLKYIRYADDFIIGVNGSREDCEWIKTELKKFIGENLKMELSEEKTLITHSTDRARFLGYDISIRRTDVLKTVNRQGTSHTKRTLLNKVNLEIPLKDKIEKFLFNLRAVEIKNSVLFPVKRGSLIRLTDMEIVSAYNAELRGICNYYGIASNFYRLDYLSYLMEYSCLKTLAAKHKSSISKIKVKFSDRKGKWCIPFENKSGKQNLYFADWRNSKDSGCNDTIHTSIRYKKSTTALDKRIMAKVCEMCGTTESSKYEVHHVNKVKNLRGKVEWERIMIAKNRKTLIVCWDCHHKVIHGKQEKK